MKKILGFIAFILFIIPVEAQLLNEKVQMELPNMEIYDDPDDPDDEEWEDGSGFGIGITLGAYFANNKSANLYNGSCGTVGMGEPIEIQDPSGVRCHTIMERLKLDINTIKHINDYYGSTDFFGPYDMHPTNMRYQPAFMYGLNLCYNFSYESAFFVEINSMRVKTVDQFTLQFVGTTLPPNSQTDVRLFTIYAEEDRFHLRAGFDFSFLISDNSYLFTEFSGTMLGIKMRENKVTVAETDYSLFLGSDNPQQIINYQPVTQVGFGFGFATGMKFYFQDYYRMDLGIGLSRDKTMIFNYEENLWNFSIFGRFSI